MIRLLFDENFDHDILRGLQLRVPALNAVTVQSARLQGASDAELLSWAAAQGLILVTHDLNTVPKSAYQRLKTGESIAGVLWFLPPCPSVLPLSSSCFFSLAAWNTSGGIKFSTCRFDEEPASDASLSPLIPAAHPVQIDHLFTPLLPGSPDEFVFKLAAGVPQAGQKIVSVS